MKGFIITGLLFVPVVSFAATINEIIINFQRLVATATPIVVALAVLFFFWGLALFILNAGDEEKRSKGRSIMIWGVIAIFVIFTVFGLVNVLSETFDIEEGGTRTPPSILKL